MGAMLFKDFISSSFYLSTRQVYKKSAEKMILLAVLTSWIKKNWQILY